MPSLSFLTKAFIAGFLFGHLFIPAEKSWLFKLARSPALDIFLSDSNAASTRNESQQAQGADLLGYLVNDDFSVPSYPSFGNLSVPSNVTTGLHLTPAHSPTSQPTLPREISTSILPNNSNPATYRPSATRTTVSTTLYYIYGLPSASVRPLIRVVTPPHRPTGPGSFQFSLTLRSLLLISALLYRIILLVYRKWKPRHKMRRLPERVVSMIMANLQGDPQSLKACSLVSRSWTKESHRHLFHTISLDSEQSADLWFSPETHGLVSHVRSIRMSMEVVAGTEHRLSRFPCVKALRVSGWHGSRHSLPMWWSPLDRTVDHLELVQPEGTPHEILTFVSYFTSLESLYITRSHRRSTCEVRTTRAGKPATVCIGFRALRQPLASSGGLTCPCSGNGISVWLHFDPQSAEAPLTVFLGCANAQTTRPCSRCFTGRSLACPLSRLILSPPCPTLSTIRINTLPEEMIGMTDSLLTSLPSISPQSTKVTIERFHDVDTIPVEEILPRFRRLGGVVEIGEQRIRI